MISSIKIPAAPELSYLLRLADTCLILGQRLGEWCGHAPILEEDIALSNMALDLIGQSRALLTLAGQRSGGSGFDEDQLAFLRDEIDYRNPTLAELPRGDFAFTVLRNLIVVHLAQADVGTAARFQRRRTRRHRRQGAEGSALPPAARRRLGGAPGRRHRGIAPPLRSCARPCGSTRRSCSRMMRWMPRPRRRASARPGRNCRSPGWRRWRTSSARPDSPYRQAGLPQQRQARPAQRAHGLPAGRDAVPAARLPRRRVVTAAAASRDSAWAALNEVLDPEVPALSVVDLGLVREVIEHDDGLEIVLTPTYSGCPATEVIEQSVLDAIEAAGLGPARVTHAPCARLEQRLDQRRGPAQAARVRHRAARPGAADGAVPIRIVGRRQAAVPCPRCASARTERLSAFGSTACKSLHRCLDCREPFEHFKPI
jgi:ring-1,2-phenylacetyl-CoA epoxidase subunit PaaD